MESNYEGVESEKIKEAFEKALQGYPRLQHNSITLIQASLKHSTMQAQPVLGIRSLVSGIKRYRVKLGFHVRDQKDLVVEDLDEQVLIGWFAHELGHVLDYQRRSNWNMLAYGVRYLASASFRKKVEHEADYIAISKGFHHELIATKRYIMEHQLIDDRYKNKMRRYYLPEDQVLVCAEDKMLMAPYIHL